MIYTSFDNLGLVKVLSFLKSHKSEYLSGQDLSDVLKISRVAVWKHIKRIRSLDYEIESKQNLGYRLVSNTKRLLPWELTTNLKTKMIGNRVYYLENVDSTQNFAASIANSSKENGTVVIAQKQSSGKGRLGRRWISPSGGLWFSIIIHPQFDISYVTLFPLAASLALAYAIEKTLQKKVELKWPNDITLNGKKVAGMLVDLSIKSNYIESLILGVGINFKVEPHSIEKTIKNTGNFYGVSTLIKKNENKSPIKLMQQFLLELEEICMELNHGNVKQVIKNWTKKSSTIGRKVSVSTSQGKINGNAVRIDHDGALVITHLGKTRRVLVGDVL